DLVRSFLEQAAAEESDHRRKYCRFFFACQRNGGFEHWGRLIVDVAYTPREIYATQHFVFGSGDGSGGGMDLDGGTARGFVPNPPTVTVTWGFVK
ncbi:MAG: hypothetical protein WBR26_10725, partial [Candidatus Acidiferrum sp.]